MAFSTRPVKFSILWALLSNLIVIVIQKILPDLCTIIRNDIEAGRETKLSEVEISYMINRRHEDIRKAYRDS